MNLPAMRLQQHLRYSRGRAKIAVDLKWWMSIEEILIHPSPGWGFHCLGVDWRQCPLQQHVRVISVQQSGPKIYLPGQAPSSAHVASQLQSLLSRSEQVRSLVWRYLVARKQPVEMRNVPVLSFGRLKIPVGEPFL